MDVRETYPIHRTGDFWSELAMRCEGDLSTRERDLRVLFQPTCAGDFGELRVHFGERENEGVIQLTDAGDFGS